MIYDVDDGLKIMCGFTLLKESMLCVGFIIDISVDRLTRIRVK